MLSKKIMNIQESITLAISAKAKQMKSEGIDVIGFGAGEPDFDTPKYIKDAAKEALDKGFTKYTPAAGTIELRKAIAKKLLDDNGLNYAPTDIVVSNGAKHSLFNVFQAILNPGDEVLISRPFWVSYPELVKMADGVPVYVDTFEKDGFLMLEENIKAKITDKTKAIILNSPSNPCGGVYDRKSLEAIANICKEKNIFIVADEIYEEMVYDGNEHVSIASIDEQTKNITILVNGFSKAYSMTGWRLGYTACDGKISKAMASMQSHATSNPNSIAQYAAVVALNSPKDEIREMVKEFDRRRNIMCDLINDIPNLSCVKPKGAFYVMVNISGTLNKKYKGQNISGSLDFSEHLLKDFHVAVVPGIGFGADEYIRLSYATSESNIRNGIDRIANFAKEIQ